jgi:predicted molibdopterin-dependent oxidoreductase YjgC
VSESISFTLDGRAVSAAPDESIWQVAARQGVDIPHLCWRPEPGYRADGNCRACMVEIEGERVLAASCKRAPTPGMVVKSASARAQKARAMVFELLVADQPARADSHDRESDFWRWIDRAGMSETSRFPARERPAPDLSHPAMAVNLDACIACGLCQRACREVQHNDVIGLALRGRLRSSCRDGRLDLRGLRRMRAGLPDRRLDGEDAARSGDAAPRRLPGSFRRYDLPLLRRRLPDPRAGEGRPHRRRGGARRPGQ